jgi:hypothetical protein
MTNALHEHQRRMSDVVGRLVESLRELLSLGVKSLAREIARELHDADDSGWIPQHKSPLPPRVHCAAVRRRMRLGDPDAQKKGKTHFLTRAALDEEMRMRGSLPRVPTEVPPQDKVSRIVSKLRGSW